MLICMLILPFHLFWSFMHRPKTWKWDPRSCKRDDVLSCNMKVLTALFPKQRNQCCLFWCLKREDFIVYCMWKERAQQIVTCNKAFVLHFLSALVPFRSHQGTRHIVTSFGLTLSVWNYIMETWSCYCIWHHSPKMWKKKKDTEASNPAANSAHWLDKTIRTSCSLQLIS